MRNEWGTEYLAANMVGKKIKKQKMLREIANDDFLVQNNSQKKRHDFEPIPHEFFINEIHKPINKKFVISDHDK
jgi:hypothetical protein